MFNSRNPVYRYPTGAVPNRLPVHFKITMPRDLHCSAAKLIVKNDTAGEEKILDMFWCGMNGDQYEWWECHFAAKDPGLYFYRFSVETWRGTLKLSKSWGGEGALGGDSLWQLTVYDSSFTTPGWLSGGIMYQIFPDRFYNSGTEKQNIPCGRTIHENWGEMPDWKPNGKGKITNSDYFGGDLIGIKQKLGYIKSLGVTCIYLNPIFESHSNHRYDTADYMKIDPFLGTKEDFKELCAEAKKLGVRIILDGVFNHTGSDSVYFNREKRYPGDGAYNSKESPYYPWYSFKNWPDEYDSWWGFDTLPSVNKCNSGYNNYINGENGVIQKWLGAGASGWRLDVADELPDEFLDSLRMAAKLKKNDALIAGEVWEDASNKTAYGKRRRYLLGKQLDSVMNYPFRSAVLGFLKGSKAEDMMEIILSIVENYPPQVLCSLMNNIGTHDTPRAITVLAGESLGGHGRAWQSRQHLTKENRKRGLALMRLASLMQFTLPGVPCIYYGDETGMEGYRDPFNRRCFPWENEDAGLLSWYRHLGKIRLGCPCLKDGAFTPLTASGNIMAYIRSNENGKLLCAFNSSDSEKSIYIPAEWQNAQALIGTLPDKSNALALPPLGCCALFIANDYSPENAAEKEAEHNNVSQTSSCGK